MRAQAARLARGVLVGGREVDRLRAGEGGVAGLAAREGWLVVVLDGGGRIAVPASEVRWLEGVDDGPALAPAAAPTGARRGGVTAKRSEVVEYSLCAAPASDAAAARAEGRRVP